MITLGIHVSFNGTSHDSSASIIINKSVAAACEEERFNRQKSSQLFFPHKSIKFCLNKAKVNIEDIDLISVDGKTFKNMRVKVVKSMKYYFGFCPKIEIVEHSLSHSYGSFLSSGYKSLKYNTNTNEPIVNSPLDAIKTFFGSGIDILYINKFKITK